MNIQKWLQKNTADLHGKVVVLTGATGGLGSVLSRYLVQLNAQLIMVDYDQSKMDALKAQLMADYPQVPIQTIALNLNEIDEVKVVAQDLLEQQIDYLILNAGVYDVPLSQGPLGYNNVFQINFISQYYLVKTLLPTLARNNGKVVATGSIAYRGAALDETDLDYSHYAKATQIYGNSKRFLMLALSELFQTVQTAGVKLSLVHPGVTLTPMTNAQNKKMINITMKMFFPKPETAALSILRGLFVDIDPDCWVGPRVADIWGAPAIQKLKSGSVPERAKIFARAEKIMQEIGA